MQKLQNNINDLFVLGKKSSQYRNLVKILIEKGDSTIPELAKELLVSVPTITKVVNELVKEGYIAEVGKKDNSSGRLPMQYNLNPSSGYFIGVDPGYSSINIGVINFSGEMVDYKMNIPFKAENTPESLDELVSLINDFIEKAGIDKKKVLNACVNISGRVNPETGYSYNAYSFLKEPLAKELTRILEFSACIENDTRAMTYG